MVTAIRTGTQDKPTIVTLDDYLDFEVMAPSFRRVPADVDELAVAREARCSRCGAVGMRAHAFRRMLERVCLFECCACGHTTEV